MVKKYFNSAYHATRDGFDKAKKAYDGIHPGIKTACIIALPGAIPVYLGVEGAKMLVRYVRRDGSGSFSSDELLGEKTRKDIVDSTLEGRVKSDSFGDE